MAPNLLPVDKALEIVLAHVPVLPFEEVGYQDAAGRILQEEVRADADAPPFDRSLMDGYAVVAADLVVPGVRLRVIEEIPAGTDPARLASIIPGSASRIMTGAPLPPGADAVVMVEETETAPGAADAILVRSAVRPGDNVARRGGDVRTGDLLLAAGDFVGAAEVAVLAAVGRTRVKVGGRPRAAVLATGNEIVPPEEAPPPGAIRNSNGPMLRALARRSGADAVSLGIAPDDEPALRERIEIGLRSDLLLISGGVSMGTCDLVGEALRAAGVEILFDKVAIKPGKPFTFGRRGSCSVFGCPGNPVSSYVIFQVFARPALRRLAGAAHPTIAPVRGILEGPVRQRPGRTGYYQTQARFTGDGYSARVLPTSGSADFVSCALGNALAVVPSEIAGLEAGAAIDLLLLDDHAER